MCVEGSAVADRRFPRGIAPTPKGDASLLFYHFFSKNRIKMKNLYQGGAYPFHPIDPPIDGG